MEVEINKQNCFNVWFDDNYVVWTRLIDNKLYTYRNDHLELGLLDTLSSLSSMDNEHFKLICELCESTSGE